MTSIASTEANQLIRAQAVTRYLRTKDILYASQNAYHSAVRCAIRGGLLTTSGMRYHIPGEDLASVKNRMYLIWEGQHIEGMKESIAFAYMLQKVPFVVMCPS